ncbi:MAG TPA: peptidylprolyl isomerase [Gemmatimonadaceae bacterium]|nr:peptidylprolyl isomerase [Gemmatimonadaceae bacterium]
MLLRKSFLLLGLIVGPISVASVSARAQRLPGGVGARDVALYARLLAMTDTRQLDTALIERALATRWRTLRAAAALSIGQVGIQRGRGGLSRLRALLADRDTIVAANAAYALGLLRDTSTIDALRIALASNSSVAREAAWALGEIGAPTRNVLAGALKSYYRPDIAIQLLLASAKLRPVPLKDIEPYLHNGNPSVVWAAAYAIARTRVPAGVGDLLALESSPIVRENQPRSVLAPGGPYADPGRGGQLARAEIARGIAKSAAGDSLGTKALVVLSRLVGDPDPHVRINAIRSIATYGPVAKAALTYATHDVDANVRVAAAQSFGTVLTVDAPDFPGLWAADTSLVYRSSLLASAARAGLRPPALTEWVGNPDWRLRAAVASAEGDTLDRAFAFSRAAPLTRDADPRVREAAYAALSPSAGMPLEDTVHALLIGGLSDPDFYVRATIIGALADRPSVADLRAVLASYDAAAHDSANDARLAAIQYIGALWKKDSTSLDAATLQRLAARPVPADPLERTAAASLPFWKTWSDVPGLAKPIGFYEGIVRSIVIPASTGRKPNATIYTVRGPIRLELFGDAAPLTVANFLALARSGYYRNTRFHRVVPNFVAQDGDPRDDGNGGPGYAIRDEMNPNRYERGAVGMALSGPDTGGSQYFITHSPQPHLDGHYTVFGRVIAGLDVLDKIVQGDRITRVDSR